MTEHEPVAVLAKAVEDAPYTVKVYCGGSLVEAHRLSAGWFCGSCGRKVKAAW